jgi:hypothetical protein
MLSSGDDTAAAYSPEEMANVEMIGGKVEQKLKFSSKCIFQLIATQYDFTKERKKSDTSCFGRGISSNG